MKYTVIVFSTSNLDGVLPCVQSIAKQEYPLHHLQIILLHPSGQNISLSALQSCFASVEYCSYSGNLVKGLNKAASKAKGEWLFFLDSSAMLSPDCLQQLESYSSRFDTGVGFELCKFPTEESKHFDPVTLQINYLSFGCFVIKTSAFQQVGGFDPYFQLLASVDLCWRLRLLGSLHYCPKAVVHMPLPTEDCFRYTHTKYERLLLAAKYCTNKKELAQHQKQYQATLQQPKHYPNVRKELLKLYIQYHMVRPFVSYCPLKQSVAQQNIPDFREGFAPQRGLFSLVALEQKPLVSIIIRTHNRKESLCYTLQSLCNQTYPNFEVVIVEDGENTAQQMVEEKFSFLPIRYFSTGEHVGRGKAGNIGIAQAKGEYICFLDDDDFYYPDYLAAHLSVFQQNPAAKLVFSSMMAAKASVVCSSPYQLHIKELSPVIFDHINLMDMCVKCRIPISGAMFHRSLYTVGSGMREDLEGDEDWAMWLRFMAKGSRCNAFMVDIPRAVSLCIFPAEEHLEQERNQRYAAFDKAMLYDPALQFTVDGAEIQQWEQQLQRDIAHLKNTGRLQDFLQTLNPLGIEKLTYSLNKSNCITARQINNYYYYLVKEYTKDFSLQ